MKPEKPQPGDVPRWPDGTKKSTNNAFTSHGYVPGKQVERAKKPPVSSRAERAFGFPGGHVPGMGYKV